MKERRENTNKGITKTVILKTARDIMILDIICMILVELMCIAMGIPEFWKMGVAILLFWDVILIYFLGLTYADREKDKIKAQMAKDIFRKDDSTIIYPKVFPKRGHFKQRKFFEEELPQIADYFANLYEDGKIEVVAKLKDRKMILHIEYISKENFTDAYDVLETTLTDSLS